MKKVYYVHGRGNKLIISFPEVKAGEAVISAIAIAKPGRSNINIDAAGPVMSDSYWQDLDKDTIAKYSKKLLPKDSEAFPSVKYKPTAKGEWTISPGVAREYALRPADFHLFTVNEYIDLVIDFVRRVRPDMVLERFVSQSPRSLLIAPDWGLKNYEFNHKLLKRMRELNAVQGDCFQ